MARFERISVTVDEAARLLHVQAETVRRRLRAKELRPDRDRGGVLLSPLEDWLRVEDAAALLGVAPATVRANVKRGRLTGRREEHGRWRVQLGSALEDRRVDPDALAAFTPGGREASPESGEPSPASTRARTTRRARSSRDVFARLYDDEPELLERCVDRHGSLRGAIVAGLRAIDDDAASSVDVAELRSAHELQGAQLERVRTAHRNLSDHVRGRLVDEVYCHHCERLVPIAELDERELADGTVELFHRPHGHRAGSKLRSSTVIARRAPVELELVDASRGDRRDNGDE